jgi:hypothetical protein
MRSAWVRRYASSSRRSQWHWCSSCKVVPGKASSTWSPEPTAVSRYSIAASGRPLLFALLLLTAENEKLSRQSAHWEDTRRVHARTSVRAAERLARARVRPVLHEQLLYPFHLRREQALCLLESGTRQELCQWFLRKCGEIPFYISRVPVGGFTVNGTLNFHTRHMWTHSVQFNPDINNSSQLKFGLVFWELFRRPTRYAS